MAVAVRRLVEGRGAVPDARPRLVVVCLGNGAGDTNFSGRPPSAHRVLERQLHEEANVIVVRVHEAGTTKARYTLTSAPLSSFAVC